MHVYNMLNVYNCPVYCKIGMIDSYISLSIKCFERHMRFAARFRDKCTKENIDAKI